MIGGGGQPGDQRLVHGPARHQRPLERDGRVGRGKEDAGLIGATVQRTIAGGGALRSPFAGEPGTACLQSFARHGKNVLYGSVRTCGPSSVMATLCSKCADRLPSAVTTVQPSSSSAGRAAGRRSPSARSRAPCPRAAAAPARPGRSWGPRDPRASRCRCRARRTPARPKSPPARATPSTAAPMSPSRSPGAATRDRGVERGLGAFEQPQRLVVDRADRDRDRGVGVPALDDRAAVDRHDVAVVDDPVAGDAVHDHLVRRDAGHRRESRGSRGSSSGRPAGRAPRARPRRDRPVVAPGLAASVHASCISATTRARPAHERDLLGRLAQDHRASVTYAAGVDDLDEALEHVVAFADTADLREHAALAVVLDDRHRLLFVELRAGGRSLPRCRRRAARRGRRTCRRSSRPSGGRFTWYTRWQFSHTRRPASRSSTMSRGTSRLIARSSGRPSSTRSSSWAWCSVRGNPSSTKPSPSGPPGARHSSMTPTTISSGTSSPPSM